ncbi:MAG: hypothetical protein KF734_08965 [Saprospiraceae bacterium]|nr:hypothetical protein [Saprospiraceae bacterium]
MAKQMPTLLVRGYRRDEIGVANIQKNFGESRHNLFKPFLAQQENPKHAPWPCRTAWKQIPRAMSTFSYRVEGIDTFFQRRIFGCSLIRRKTILNAPKVCFRQRRTANGARSLPRFSPSADDTTETFSLNSKRCANFEPFCERFQGIASVLRIFPHGAAAGWNVGKVSPE